MVRQNELSDNESNLSLQSFPYIHKAYELEI